MADIDASKAIEAIIAGMAGINAFRNYNPGNQQASDASYVNGTQVGTTLGEWGGKLMGMYFELRHELIDLDRSMMEAQASIVSAKLDLINQTVETAMGSIKGGFESNANRLAASQTKAMMNLAKANVHADYQIRYAHAQMGVAQLAMTNKIAGTISQFTESVMGTGISAAGATISNILGTKAGQAILQAGAVYGMGYVGEKIGNILTNNGQPDGTAGDVLGVTLALATKAFGDKAGVVFANNAQYLLGATTSLMTAINGMVFGFQQQQLQLQVDLAKYHLEVMKQAQEIAEQYIQSAQKLVEPFIDITDKLMQATEKFDTSIRQFSVTAGYIGDQGDAYVKGQLAMAEHLAMTFGKTNEEMMAVTKSYQEAAGGRQVNMSQAAYDTQFSTGRLFGMADNEVAGLYGGMNIFNTSIESAGDHMSKMYHTLTKMGLSTSKFGKELVENLKKAQKYNFKGGVENMMKLTQWAQQTRFNLDNATSFSDKLLGGTLSDALEASAKLQVLGGAAAIYSDPLGMIYDAGADVGSLAKRQAGMFSDLSGTFNSKTGETDFSWYENYMIKQRAAAAGMSEEDAKNMIRQQNKQGVIDKVLKGYGLDEETRTAIGNRATYNQKTGAWEVTGINGETHNIEDYASGKISLDNLLPENNDEAMLKIAEKSLGFEEMQTNLQKALVFRFAPGQYDNIKEASMRNMASEEKLYENPHMNEALTYFIDKTSEMYEASNEGAEEVLNNPQVRRIVDNYFQGVLRETSNVNKNWSSLDTAMQKFAESSSGLYTWVQSQISVENQLKEQINAGQKAFQDSLNLLVNTKIEEIKGAISGKKSTDYSSALTSIGGSLSTISSKIGNLAGNGTSYAFSIFGGQSSVYDLLDNALQGNGPLRKLVRGAINGLSAGVDWVKSKFGDGMGQTNGGYITNATHVTPINDGLVKTDVNDKFVVAKDGSWVDKAFNGAVGGIHEIESYIKSGKAGAASGPITVNLVMSGKLELEGDGNVYDIIEKLKTNTTLSNNMAAVLARGMTDALKENADKGRFNSFSV